jgi:hypothetical protein
MGLVEYLVELCAGGGSVSRRCGCSRAVELKARGSTGKQSVSNSQDAKKDHWNFDTSGGLRYISYCNKTNCNL